MTSNRLKVAVIFGGRSPEHDVSIVSGLQVLNAIDQGLYDAYPLYIHSTGRWFAGHGLRSKQNYPINPNKLSADIFEVFFNIPTSTTRGKAVFEPMGSNAPKASQIYDLVFPVLHGTNGEDGAIQGVMELANIPYTGMRQTASTIVMDKVLAKRFFERLQIPVLPCVRLKRPKHIEDSPYLDVSNITKDLNITYPVCAKPNHLGSSIGVHLCKNEEDLQVAILDIFKKDTDIIIEPFIPNLVEYNVATRRLEDGSIVLSAIEKPTANSDIEDGKVLDFKDKYKSGSNSSKLSVQSTDGMVSAKRTLNPTDLSLENKNLILEAAALAFEQMGGTGAPRFDFYGNKETGEIWLNEINPMPGSYGYFLWEKAPELPIFFTDFTTALIKEALDIHSEKSELSSAANEAGASLF